MTIAMDKMIKARAGLILDNPFFGSLALRLKFKVDVSCKTAWVNGIELGFNPDFVIGLSLDETKGLIAHEIMHCALNHQNRRNNRDSKDWNIACDLAINPILSDSRFVLPKGALFENGMKDKSAEEIFSIVQGRKPKESQGQGQGNGQGQSDSQNGQKGSKQGKNDTSENGQGQDSQGQGSNPEDFGEVRDCPNGQGQDSQENEENWKIATIQAAQTSKAQGSHVPDSIKRMVEDILNPKLDWREILRRFIQSNAKNDYSWQRPNRRYIHQGLYLPSLYSEELGEIVLMIDTSGSISQNELTQFASELSDILEQYPSVKLTTLYIDTSVRNVEEFTYDDLPLKLNAKGGGGTSFIPGFKWIEENDKEPICVIYFTDGYCNRYPIEPDYPVLWIGTYKFIPKFGEFAYLY